MLTKFDFDFDLSDNDLSDIDLSDIDLSGNDLIISYKQIYLHFISYYEILDFIIYLFKKFNAKPFLPQGTSSKFPSYEAVMYAVCKSFEPKQIFVI